LSTKRRATFVAEIIALIGISWAEHDACSQFEYIATRQMLAWVSSAIAEPQERAAIAAKLATLVIMCAALSISISPSSTQAKLMQMGCYPLCH
jgi:hypothetical protein